jgi:hypothetical protein
VCSDSSKLQIRANTAKTFELAGGSCGAPFQTPYQISYHLEAEHGQDGSDTPQLIAEQFVPTHYGLWPLAQGKLQT